MIGKLPMCVSMSTVYRPLLLTSARKLKHIISKTLPCVWENVYCIPLRLAHSPHCYTCADGSPASSSRLRRVLSEQASRGNAYPMMPHGRPGRGSKTNLDVRVRIENNAVVWIAAGWHALGVFSSFKIADQGDIAQCKNKQSFGMESIIIIIICGLI